jgi:peptidyl-prolyl cis-trans isomerase D
MMESLRKHVKGWLGMVIIVGISLSFALVGLQSYTGDGTEQPVAEVADRKIYQGDVNNAYQQRVSQLKEQYADQYSPDLFSEEALRNESLNQLVQEQLILHTVDSDGYEVSDQAVLKVISELEAFQTNGQFDKSLYEQLLRAKGLTSTGFVQQVKVGLIRDQFVRGIVDTTLVDDSEINDFYRLNNQVRDVEYITLPLESKTKLVSVTDDELQKNYLQNEHLYKTPEQVSVEYVELNLANLMADVNPSEAELRAFYESEKQSFTAEGRRRASHILFDAPSGTPEKESEEKRKLAEEVLLKIQSGEDFTVLAKQYSDDIGSAKQGGDLGIINKGMMDDVFEKTLSELTVDQSSEVVQTPFGFHIIKLTELEESTVKSFDAAKEEIELSYKQKIAGEQFYQMSERLAELSFENPGSLDPVVDELGLKINQQVLFGKDQGEGIAANDKVRHAAFIEDFLAGNNSEVVEVESEHLIVMHLIEHKPASTVAFEDVKGAVELAVRQYKAGVELKKEAEGLLKEVLASKSLQAAAKSKGLTVNVAGPITRNDKTAPPAVIRDAFSMSHPEDEKPSFKMSFIANGDIAIVGLNKITDGDKASIDDKSRESFKKFLERLKGEVSLAASLANLSVDADVKFTNQPQ